MSRCLGRALGLVGQDSCSLSDAVVAAAWMFLVLVLGRPRISESAYESQYFLARSATPVVLEDSNCPWGGVILS